MLAEVVRSALDDEALAGGLSTRLSDMKARLERLEERAKRKRQLVLRAMAEAEIPKLTEADFTASMRSGAPTVEVVAEDKIPAAYWKPQPSKLDKQGILAALKSGATVDGRVSQPTPDAIECEDQVMALTEKQAKALRAKLNHRHVKTRESQGASIAYVEGWHVIAEANRIFGFENWDRQTQTPACLWSEAQRGQTVCFYSAKVRITVRAGETVTVREGIGTGLGRSPQAETAHEMALKAAETDATKRALATFGNPFGLALYDREQTHVTKPREKLPPPRPPISLLSRPADERTLDLDSLPAFVAATERELQKLDTLDAAYAFWTRNLSTFTDIGRLDDGRNGQTPRGPAPGPLARHRGSASRTGTDESPVRLLIPKETRIRDRDHLAFVASQPCLVCGRRPAQAHHLKFAQPRAMSLKVSDEYTVPLCNGHHDELHRTGDERAWWARHGIIEPLKFAARLWAASRHAERAIFRGVYGHRRSARPPAIAKPDEPTAPASVERPNGSSK